jgi:hypothetical protein
VRRRVRALDGGATLRWSLAELRASRARGLADALED